MKEMSLTHSEPFHFLEFRHGPKSMVTGSTCVIGLQSSVNTKHESAVLADMQTLGGRVVELARQVVWTVSGSAWMNPFEVYSTCPLVN